MSQKIIKLFEEHKKKPLEPKDMNAKYRSTTIREFLAIAVDEFYCNPSKRKDLRLWYPKMHDFIEKEFQDDLATIASSSL